MALANTALKELVMTELQAQGIDTGNEHCQVEKLATAIASAVVTHITTAGVVTVAVVGGSSAGSHIGVIS